jgi:hypothetical protein
MPSIKITVLAMATAVAAVPYYGAHSSAHAKYHSSKVAHGKPYPTGGWPGAFNNSTRIPQATGTGGSGGDTTIDVTSTSTTTLVKTVLIKPSPVASESGVKAADNEGGQGGQCGPATITVTAHEAVTVTVTPGGGAGVPASSVVAVESKSKGEGYPVNSTPKGEEKPTPTPVVPSSKVEMPTPTPVVPSSKAPEVPVVPSSKAEEYKPSSVQKPVEASSAAVSSAPAPSKTPSTGGSYTGSKRGLAYNDASLCKNFGSKFGFAYNWGQVENNDVGTQYIPMMHRPSESTPEAWLQNVKKACDKGTKAVMGFNEPDHAAQANLSPEAACSAWKQYMNPIASNHPDVTIIGPSVTNGGGSEASDPNMGLGWLQRFHDSCPDAIIHATNIHFYDIYQDATIDRFIAQVEKAAEIYGKPVWVTEFGLNPGSASPDQALKFLKAAMAYLDGSDKVQGYSWFMVGSGENQLNSGSGLSALGEAYAAY